MHRNSNRALESVTQAKQQRRRPGKWQWQSLLTQANIATVVMILPLLALFAVQYGVSGLVKQTRDQLLEEDIPSALTAWAMVNTLGDIHGNLLEYMLDEPTEKSTYYRNLESFHKLHSELPPRANGRLEHSRLDHLIDEVTEHVEEKVFSVDNQQPKAIKERAENIEAMISAPLRSLHDGIIEQLRARELGNKHRTSATPWPEAEHVELLANLLRSMSSAALANAALHRHAHNDLRARRDFFKHMHALDRLFEQSLNKLGPLGFQAEVDEMRRLETDLRRLGSTLIDDYAVREFMIAEQTIDELEHHNLHVSEEILAAITRDAKKDIERRTESLEQVLEAADAASLAACALGLVFLLFYAHLIRRSLVAPVVDIAAYVDAMRRGERGLQFGDDSSITEIRQIEKNLSDFQNQLSELEALRDSQLHQTELSHIAEIKKAYAELEVREQKSRKIANDLRIANENLEQFVHIASHDLREPLKKMSAFSDMLAHSMEGELSPESIELIRSIQQNSRSMSSLIDDLRSLTQVYASDLELGECNLGSLLQSVLSTHSEKLQQRRASISVGSLPSVPGYAGLLTQVFDNLVRNALIHGDSKMLMVSFSSEQTEDEVLIRVSNSVSQAVKGSSKLLQPFVKGRKTGGTGMGLAICKRVVDVHGGDIAIDTSNDHLFTVTIGLKRRPQQPTSNTMISAGKAA